MVPGLSRGRMALWTGLVLTAGFFLARTLLRDLGRFDAEAARVDWRMLGWATAIALVYHAGMAAAWMGGLRALGERLSFARAMNITYLASLAVYVPGKIWVPAGRIWMSGRHGLHRARVGASLVLEGALNAAAAAAWAAGAAGLATGVLGPALSVPIVAAVALGLAGLCHPKILGLAVNGALRALRREPVELDLSFPALLGLMLSYLALWGLYGAGLWCVANAVADLPPAFAPRLLAFHCLAFVAGMAAPFAPAGLGVREGVLAALLAPTLTLPVAALVAVAARLWVAGTQLLAAAVGAALARALEPEGAGAPAPEAARG